VTSKFVFITEGGKISVMKVEGELQIFTSIYIGKYPHRGGESTEGEKGKRGREKEVECKRKRKKSERKRKNDK
jgi:hypothetical protein